MSTKEIILAVTPTITGSISCAASVTIILKILKSRTRLNCPYNRILFGMSVSDVVFSVASMCSTYTSPRSTPNVWGAIGNETTCQIRGFLALLSITTTPFYNCALCIYYLCVVKYSMRDERFSRRIEPALHLIPICWSSFTAIYLLSLGLINNAGPGGCWIAPYPSDCIGNPDVDCIRGEESVKFYRLLFNVSFGLATFVVILVTMVMILCSVWRQEVRMNQYRFSMQSSHFGTASGPQTRTGRRNEEGGGDLTTSPTRRRRSSTRLLNPRLETARAQAILYAAAFLLSTTPSIILRLVDIRNGDKQTQESAPFWLMFAARFLYPLQGLFNIIAFLRPQVVALRRRGGDHPGYSLVAAFFVALRTLDLDRFTTIRSRNTRRSSRHLETITTELEVTCTKRFLKLVCKACFQKGSRDRQEERTTPGAAGRQNHLQNEESPDPSCELDLDSQSTTPQDN